MRHVTRLPVPVALALFLVACGSGSAAADGGPDADADADTDGDTDGDGDGDADGDTDGDADTSFQTDDCEDVDGGLLDGCGALAGKTVFESLDPIAGAEVTAVCDGITHGPVFSGPQGDYEIALPADVYYIKGRYLYGSTMLQADYYNIVVEDGNTKQLDLVLIGSE